MTGRLTTLGEVLRELEAAEDHGAPEEAAAPEHAAAPAVEIREDRVRRKLAVLRSMGADGTFTLRAAIRLQSPAKAAN